MTARFIVADVMDGLASLETGSVDLVVTSPPFLALRSYLPADHELKSKEIGSESTPAEFIDVLLRVTAELRRVLAPHGSICVELGDTYAGSMTGDVGSPYRGVGSDGRSRVEPVEIRPTLNLDPSGWPLSKSRTLIPSLYQIALAYGFNPLTGLQSPAGQWRIRNIITWARPNPPVGALGDKWRPATSDLVIACMPGKRYWDDLATRSPFKTESHPMGTGTVSGVPGVKVDRGYGPSGAPLLDYWVIPLLEGGEEKPYGPSEPKKRQGTNWNSKDGPNTSRNDNGAGNFAPSAATESAGSPLLDYWVIPPGGYSGAHYAVFPEELVVPCVQAMTPQRVCVTCGEPSRRIVSKLNEERSDIAAAIETGRTVRGLRRRDLLPLFIGHYKNEESVLAQISNWELGKNVPVPKDWDLLKDRLGIGDEYDELIEAEARWNDATYEHVSDHPSGWTQAADGRVYQRLPARKNRIEPDPEWTDCGHDNWRPGLVLDPFAGSGTTGAVATGHGHDAILIDLDERNADLARDRIGPFLFEMVDLPVSTP